MDYVLHNYMWDREPLNRNHFLRRVDCLTLGKGFPPGRYETSRHPSLLQGMRCWSEPTGISWDETNKMMNKRKKSWAVKCAKIGIPKPWSPLPAQDRAILTFLCPQTTLRVSAILRVHPIHFGSWGMASSCMPTQRYNFSSFVVFGGWTVHHYNKHVHHTSTTGSNTTRNGDKC